MKRKLLPQSPPKINEGLQYGSPPRSARGKAPRMLFTAQMSSHPLDGVKCSAASARRRPRPMHGALSPRKMRALSPLAVDVSPKASTVSPDDGAFRLSFGGLSPQELRQNRRDLFAKRLALGSRPGAAGVRAVREERLRKVEHVPKYFDPKVPQKRPGTAMEVEQDAPLLEINLTTGGVLGQGNHMRVYSLPHNAGVVLKTWERALERAENPLEQMVIVERKALKDSEKVKRVMAAAHDLVEWLTLAGVPVTPILNSKDDSIQNWRIIAPFRGGDTYDKLAPELQVEKIVQTQVAVFAALVNPELPYFHPDLLPDNFHVETGELMDTVDIDSISASGEELAERFLFILDQSKESKNGLGLPFNSAHYARMLTALNDTLAVLEPLLAVEMADKSAPRDTFEEMCRQKSPLEQKVRHLNDIKDAFKGRFELKRAQEQAQ